MNVLIGSRIHVPCETITACGRLIPEHAGQVESEATCLVCIKAARTIRDPEGISIPRLVFGKPESGDQYVEAVAIRKVATKSTNRVLRRQAEIEKKLKVIRGSFERGALSARCSCGKLPWEHTQDDTCGPRNKYRIGKLLALYKGGAPHASLDGSNTLVKKAIK